MEAAHDSSSAKDDASPTRNGGKLSSAASMKEPTIAHHNRNDEDGDNTVTEQSKMIERQSNNLYLRRTEGDQSNRDSGDLQMRRFRRAVQLVAKPPPLLAAMPFWERSELKKIEAVAIGFVAAHEEGYNVLCVSLWGVSTEDGRTRKDEVLKAEAVTPATEGGEGGYHGSSRSFWNLGEKGCIL